MLEYIKSLISANTLDRVSAFLAVIAGVSLCIGFFVVLGILLFSIKNVNYPLFIISASLVTLATFSKVDNLQQQKPEIKKDNQDNV